MQALADTPPVGLTPEAKAAKRAGQKEEILLMLMRAGHHGCTSEQLNKVAFRYASSIHRLRQDGYLIETVGRSGTELARYILKGNLKPGEQIPLFSGVRA